MQFRTIDIVSVMAGRLLGEVGDLYGILNYMTGDDIYTSQIPYAMEVCGPFLKKQFPELAQEYPKEKITNSFHGRNIKAINHKYGETCEVAPLPDGLWFTKDPKAEMEKYLEIKTDMTNGGGVL